ncbi:hypothetical protein ACFFSY_31145 [Paenibacillus aurantiacus]|uniref:Uncharacterized protein n=1 Tax=Paenibacillus aurantiacus TaxID=1936118 RepID=A0ABV5KZP7_9BACL
MIQYDSDDIREMRMTGLYPTIERRDEQWIDIELRIDVEDESQVHQSITELTALVICTHSGVIAQIVPQDAGCDCDFQFTAGEKEQIRNYVLSSEIQAKILAIATPQ